MSFPDADGNGRGSRETVLNSVPPELLERQISQLNSLSEKLLGRERLHEKLRLIAEAAVEMCRAEFARIWIIKEGDMCGKGCHHECRDKSRCLHLAASAGRYSGLDGSHSRVPLGAHGIGHVAAGGESFFLTHDVIHDPGVLHHDWAADLGLTSLAGLRLNGPDGCSLGALALFAKQRIADNEKGFLKQLANMAAQVIQSGLAEEALRESESRFRSLVNNTLDMITVLAPDGTMLYESPSVKTILGHELDALVGRNCLDFIHPDDVPEVKKHYANVLEHPGAVSSVQFRFRHANGSYIPLEVVASSFLDDPGIKGLVVNSRDITERMRMEEERHRIEIRMREVQKLESLGILAGGIAHDFNNLLMAILGNADLARHSLAPDAAARQNIEEIIHASHRASELCRQMLAYSGKGRFIVDFYDIADIVRGMGQMLEVSISKKASVRYALAPSLPAVEIDATQIRQVILNLITNASESLEDAAGIISISVDATEYTRQRLSDYYLGESLPEGRYVCIEVADTGCGMDAETRSRIFDPFYTTKFAGRGLGLAAVLGIIRGHKGAIKVQSTPGRGTTFSVLLPASNAAVISSAAHATPLEAHAGDGVVLFIDDEAVVRNVGSAMLARLGYRVVTAADGRKGLEVFREQGDRIACILLDLTMPDMGGEETFYELRRLRPDARIILSSGFDEQDVTHRFANCGLTGFIQKPYTLTKLREALASALRG